MYKRKTEENLDCGTFALMKILAGKWKTCIVNAISLGAARPSEIHKYFDNVAPRVIDMQLSELLDHGVVARTTISNGYPLHVEYALTALGESLLPVIAAMDKWSSANLGFVKSRAALLSGGITPEQLPGLQPHSTGKKLPEASLCERT